jgi:hypothetical protein
MDDFRKEWFTSAELGRLLGEVTAQTIREWCNSKDVENKAPAFTRTPENRLRFHRADIEVYLHNHRMPTLDRLIMRQRTGF